MSDNNKTPQGWEKKSKLPDNWGQAENKFDNVTMPKSSGMAQPKKKPVESDENKISFADKARAGAGKFADIAKRAGGAAKNVAEGAVEYARSDEAKEKMNAVKDKARSLADGAGSKLSDLKEKASESVESIKSAAVSKAEQISGNISAKSDEAKEKISSLKNRSSADTAQISDEFAEGSDNVSVLNESHEQEITEADPVYENFAEAPAESSGTEISEPVISEKADSETGEVSEESVSGSENVPVQNIADKQEISGTPPVHNNFAAADKKTAFPKNPAFANKRPVTPAAPAFNKPTPPPVKAAENSVHEEKKSSPVIFVLIAVTALLIAGGGILGGMLLMKNKNNDGDNSSAASADNEDPVGTDIAAETSANDATDPSAENSTTAVTTVKKDDEETKVDQDKLKEAYIRTLTEFTKTDNFNAYDHASKFAFYDIDDDGIEELFIQYMTAIGNAENLYYYKNGEYTEIAHCAESSFTICPEEHCVQWYGYGGYELRSVLKLGKQGNTIDEMYVQVYPNTAYMLNDVGISASEYEKVVTKYDSMKWVRPDFYDFKAILSDDIIYAKPREYDQFLAVVDTESSDLNVRESPSADSKILGTIPKDAYVTAAHIEGYPDWYKVEYSDKNLKGYASAKYITDSDEYKKKDQESNNKNLYTGYKFIENAPSDMTFYKANDTLKGKVTTESTSLNMRQGPGTNYEVILHLNKNEIVEVLGMNSDWAYVKWSVWGAQQTLDYYGYISRDYLTIGNY